MIEDNPPGPEAHPARLRTCSSTPSERGTSPPHRRRAVAADLIDRIELLAEQAHPYDANRRLVAHVHNERHALFTFLTRPDVPATNWPAEQGVRPAVVNRKMWGGNRTWQGAATQTRMMTVLRTATQQGLDAIDWLAAFARAPDLGAATPFTQ